MNQLKLMVGIIVLLFVVGACAVKQYDSYGVVSFQIKNVD